MSTDTLSDVLRAERLTGAVYFAVDAAAPWVAESPPGHEIGPHLMPGVEHVIEYHVLTAGSCWGGIVDDTPVRLETGDVIVFPQGDAHVMSSAPGMRGPAAHEAFARARVSRLPISVKIGEGSSERTEVICGFLGCDARPFNPLLATLPRVLHVPRRSAQDGVLEQLVKLALSESLAQRAGGDVVLARLSELMFVEVVRRHIASLPPGNVGWLAGLRDENIGRVLGKLHGLDPFRALSAYAFIGDSENDAACFGVFRLTLGVRNLSGRPTLGPRFRTGGERAEGFIEAADLLLARRAELR